MTHYLVAIDLKNRKLTFNGKIYFDDLPSLVKVKSHESHMTFVRLEYMAVYSESELKVYTELNPPRF